MRGIHVGRTRFDGRRAEVDVDVAGKRMTIGMTSLTGRVRRPRAFGDVWLPLAIFPAMRLGLPITLEDPVSPVRRHGMREVQRLLAVWDPELQVQPIDAPVAARGWRRTAPPMQLMTGGVDSAHAFHARPEVADLLYLHDLDHEPAAVRAEVTTMLASLESETGRRVRRVESDARRLVEPYGEWGTQTHLAVLVATASLVAGARRRLHVPSTLPYGALVPWGSHPMLDPLYSSDDVAVVHVDAHLTRFEKVRGLRDADVLLRHLRVCYRSQDSLNCGRCEKCVRTMVALDLVGALPRATAFTEPLTIDAILALDVHDDVQRAFEADVHAAAVAAGRTDVADAIATVLARYDERAA
ncbi:hypothetical protein [Agrococcus jejuensis]|uniref:7-cyano-7-deazaguanine synthase (Queuosine biosynthesis) n=1 Tax=Agrococcus jejuensis TaxID=399736 RepID=A0A1G8GEN3_9MICO|nr:hypothetical protein [Agrococcus jejuensis]SDH92815.1 hypothetical protein SAMN04489720_2895 [Agrococcus jejuensis]